MRSTPQNPKQHTKRPSRIAIRLLSIICLAAGLIVASAGASGATADGCGEYSFGFTGTRLINDGISDAAGPYAIELPAGTYDITMWSNDNHPSADYQVEQTNEQWYFRLDNGYMSPSTKDIPADRTSVVTQLSDVTLDAASSISVHHVKIGGVNSVNVECVGFTPSAVIAGPTTTTTTVAEIAPTTLAPTTTVPVQVLPAVEVPIPQLAVTGPTSDAFVVLGLALVALGGACLAVERRTATRR